MLTETDEGVAQLSPATPADNPPGAGDTRANTAALEKRQSHFARALRIEWLGQTLASLCWIASVFVCGISSAGDWLQLGAASAWLVANIAAVTSGAD